MLLRPRHTHWAVVGWVALGLHSLVLLDVAHANPDISHDDVRDLREAYAERCAKSDCLIRFGGDTASAGQLWSGAAQITVDVPERLPLEIGGDAITLIDAISLHVARQDGPPVIARNPDIFHTVTVCIPGDRGPEDWIGAMSFTKRPLDNATTCTVSLHRDAPRWAQLQYVQRGVFSNLLNDAMRAHQQKRPFVRESMPTGVFAPRLCRPIVEEINRQSSAPAFETNLQVYRTYIDGSVTAVSTHLVRSDAHVSSAGTRYANQRLFAHEMLQRTPRVDSFTHAKTLTALRRSGDIFREGPR